MATIESVMSRDPVCCTADESVLECARIMEDDDVGMVPVVESLDTRKLIGVVTDRDLCLGVVAAGRDPNVTRVEDCMSDEVWSLFSTDDLDQALELMKVHQVRRLPIVDETGCCVGVLALADLSRVAPAKAFEETVEALTTPPGWTK